MMDTQPAINSLACAFTFFLFLLLLELGLVEEAWDRCMGLWDMHFVWECGWISQGKE